MEVTVTQDPKCPQVKVRKMGTSHTRLEMPLNYTEEKGTDKLDLCETNTPVELTKVRVLLLNLSWFGLSLLFLVMSVEVIPSQIQSLVGGQYKGRWLGGMVAGGAVLTFFLSPIIGMKSDRLQSRFGRRRPLMMVGACMLSLGLIGMALSAPELEKIDDGSPNITNADSGTCEKDLVKARCADFLNSTLEFPFEEGEEPWLGKRHVIEEGSETIPAKGNIGFFVTFYLLVISSFAVVTVPYNALLADKSHPQQRGFNSGVMGAMILTGNLAGAGIGASIMKIGIYAMYGCITGAMLLCVLITCLTTKETTAKEYYQPLGLKTLICGFWTPLKDHDFRWVFFTRFLMQQGVSTITAFLEYWVSDMVNLPNCWTAQTSVALLLLPLLTTAASCSVLFGFLSDRLGRRKPLVMLSALIMSVSAAVLAFTSGAYGYYVAIGMTSLFGIGFGAFQAVDFALVMDILPAEKDKAKDIAVWHQALILPQALATPIGGIVLDVFERVNCEIGLGYILLFLITSLYFFLSGVFVTKISAVRRIFAECYTQNGRLFLVNSLMSSDNLPLSVLYRGFLGTENDTDTGKTFLSKIAMETNF